MDAKTKYRNVIHARGVTLKFTFRLVFYEQFVNIYNILCTHQTVINLNFNEEIKGFSRKKTFQKSVDCMSVHLLLTHVNATGPIKLTFYENLADILSRSNKDLLQLRYFEISRWWLFL